MSIDLCRFDRLELFPLLIGRTDDPDSVSTQVTGQGDSAALELSVRGQPAGTNVNTVCLGFPLVAVDGRPLRFELDMECEPASTENQGAIQHVFIEAADSQHDGLTYVLRKQSGTDSNIWSADAIRPSEVWGAPKDEPVGIAVPPITLHRLVITFVVRRGACLVRLRRLTVTGDVELSPPGIAGTDSNCPT